MYAMICRLLIVAVSLTLTTCTTLQPYRDASIPDTPIKFSNVPKELPDSIKRQMWEHYEHPEFYLTTIEFSENGHLFHPKEAFEVLDRVKAIAGESGATIVVFVHGWHHNGDFIDPNQVSLRGVLGNLADLQDKTFAIGQQKFRHQIGQDLAARPPLIGISLSWRGESSTNPVLTWLSFFDRKIDAHIVGGKSFLGLYHIDDARRVISRLDADYRDLNAHKKLTSLTFVGHSFGAALLFSATEDTFKQQLLQEHVAEVNTMRQFEVKQASAPIPLIKGVGDAVILINPAFEARRYRAFGRLTEGNYSFDRRQTPKLIIFSSDGDSANRFAFPFGRYLSNALWIPSWFQWSQRTTALGFYRADQTHWLHLRCEPAFDCSDNPLNWGFDLVDAAHLDRVMQAPADFDVSRDADYGRFQLDLKDQRKDLAHTPFIVARTTHKLVPRHSTIFNAPFDNFIAKFIAELDLQNLKIRAMEYQGR